MRKTWLPWLILSPSLLFLLLFTWFPLGRSVYDSLFDTRMASDGAQYVGLDNFARLFADGVSGSRWSIICSISCWRWCPG